MRNKIVIVEDELIPAEYLKEVLLKEGFDVLAVIDTGREAVAQVLALKPDLVLMDIMLKDALSGAEAAVSIYQQDPAIAIIFLSAYSSDDMLEYAIEANSYGYLMKPYNEEEIVSTMKVVLARIEREASKNETVEAHIVPLAPELHYDKVLRRVFKNGEEVHLGNVALSLIELLCQTPNVSVSLEQIYQHVWNEAKSTTTLRTLIHRIRRQCGVDFIVSVSGVGYMVKNR